MTEQPEEVPTLKLNPDTHCYEAIIVRRIQVNPEVFRGVFLKAMADDEAADLTDPEEHRRIARRVSRVSFWEGKPTAKITYLPSVPSVPTRQSAIRPPTQAQLLEERLREAARHVAPHLWQDQCRTSIAPLSEELVTRENVGRLRYEEKKVLEHLYTLWGNGEFEIDQDAEEEERLYQENNHQKDPMETVQALKEVLDANSIH